MKVDVNCPVGKDNCQFWKPKKTFGDYSGKVVWGCENERLCGGIVKTIKNLTFEERGENNGLCR